MIVNLLALLPSIYSSYQADGEASLDLQITGVTRRNASWQYHVEVLDVRLSSFNSGRSGVSVRYLSMRNTSRTILDTTAEEKSAVYMDMPPMVRYTATRRYTDFRQLYRPGTAQVPGRMLDLLSLWRRPETAALSTTFLRPGLVNPGSFATSASLLTLLADNLSLATPSSSSISDIDTNPTLVSLIVTSPHHNSIEIFGVIAVPPVSSSGGYVSLSQVKSREIRFRKKMVPGGANLRGDLKRRRMHLHSQDADDMDVEHRKLAAKKQFVMALCGAFGFKRFVVGAGSGVIGTQRKSNGSARDRSADLLKMLSSGGSRIL
ncbi:unnamed protein product [Peronospora destructor]|uniref:Uncharacterized protein n=1 Tax=Peronospora destructor TaxID=86335 RepID=A0AAV0V0V6_9STRA|nr:unnamed protein product [Peronospora destructor]